MMFAFVAVMYAILWFIEIVLKITFWIFAGTIVAIVWVIQRIREERRNSATQEGRDQFRSGRR